MLAMRPNCECCDADLDPGGAACICSFECTFCAACADRLARCCPNCGGLLVTRPPRAPEMLARFPASTERKPINPACRD